MWDAEELIRVSFGKQPVDRREEGRETVMFNFFGLFIIYLKMFLVVDVR